MIYVKTPLTGKKSGDYTELSTPLKVTKGVLRSVEIFFPPGNAGLHQVQILLNKKLILPYNNGEWLIGDNVVLNYNVNQLVTEQPYELLILTRNYDAVYDHKLQVRCDVKTFSEITAEQEQLLLLSAIRDEIQGLRDEIEGVAVKQRSKGLSELFRRRGD